MERNSTISWSLIIFTFVTIFLSELGHCAEEYPSRPIEIICPSSPGGSTDLTMRALVAVAKQHIGQPLIPLIKAGGAQTIGTNYVAHAKPDGYTLLISAVSAIVTQPMIEKLPYSAEDFVPVARITAPSMVIGVQATSPWKTLKDFIEGARKDPGKYRYSTSGFYSAQHVYFALLSQMADIQLTHIPTGGAGPAMVMLLGGNVEISAFPTSVITPHLAAGSVRALAVIGEERLTTHKEVPTLKEAGFNITGYFWNGVLAPKSTPPDVILKLRSAFKKMVEDESFKRMMTQMGEEVKYMDGDEFAKYIKGQQEKIGPLIKTMK